MPNLPISQLPLAVSGQPESWMAIVNYDVDPSGITNKIYFSALTEQFSGASGSSGTSGSSGSDGTSGSSGSSGTSGTNGTSGSSGTSGTNGTSGSSGSSGTSGTSGSSGNDGTSGSSGSSGTSGTSGTSGSSGVNGTSGSSGTSGTSGTSPVSPFPTVYGLFAQTGNSITVSATTVESTLIDGGVGTLTVGANQFQIGDSFRADFGGLLNSRNGDDITIRVKTTTGVILADSGPQNMDGGTNDVWQFSVNFTIRQIGVAGVAEIVSLGVFHTTKQSNSSQTGFAFNTVNNTTFDTTISNTLNVTVQFSSNNALNAIYSDIFVLNKIY